MKSFLITLVILSFATFANEDDIDKTSPKPEPQQEQEQKTVEPKSEPQQEQEQKTVEPKPEPQQEQEQKTVEPKKPQPEKKAESSKKKPVLFESRAVFLEAMNHPMVAEIFRAEQLAKFSAPFDSDLRSFFSTHPVFSQVFSFISKNYNVILEGFSDSMRIGSTEIVYGLTPEYNRVRKVVQDTAIDLGFSEKAIENLKIYVISGTENAFTVSGSQDQIIIVFQRDILRTMSSGEIRAIIGHELGHIRAQHVITGQVHSVMLNLLATYISKASDLEEMTEMEVSEELHRIERWLPEHITLKGKTEELIRGMQKATQGSSGDNSRFKAMNQQKKDFGNQIQGFMQSFLTQPVEVQRVAFVQYLEVLISNLESSGSLSETVRFFKSIQKDMIESEYFRPVAREAIELHFSIASFAASQAFETSADMISNSVVKREFLASSMAKLLGADFEIGKDRVSDGSREERKQIIRQLLKQAREFRKRNKGDSAAQYLSMMTHPAPVIRVEQIMNLKKYPAIIFADPFMRLLYLRDILSSQLIEVEMQLNSATEAYENFVAQGKGVPPKLESAIGIMERVYLDVLRQHSNLSEKVTEMLINESKGGITSPYIPRQSVEFVNGYPVSEEALSSQAPRQKTLVRYLSNYRKEILNRIQYFEEALRESEGDAQTQEVFKYNLKILSIQLESTKSFVDSVLTSARNKMETMNLSVESKNLISVRIHHLERVASMRTAEELVKALLEAEAHVQEGKTIASKEPSERSALFDRVIVPRPMVRTSQAPKVSPKGMCAGYFN